MDLLHLLGLPKQRTESSSQFDNITNNGAVQISALDFLTLIEETPKEPTHTISPLSTDIPGLSDQTRLALDCLNRLNNASYNDRESIRNELFDIVKNLKSVEPLLADILPHVQAQILTKNDPEVIANEVAWMAHVFGEAPVIAPLVLKAVQERPPEWLISLIQRFNVATTAEHLSRICVPPYIKNPLGVATVCSTLREMTSKCGSIEKNEILTKLAWTCLNQMGGVIDSSLSSELTAILRRLPRADDLKPAVKQHLIKYLNQILLTLDANALSAELKWMDRFLDRQIIDSHLCAAVASDSLPANMLFLTKTPLTKEFSDLLQAHLAQRRTTPPQEPPLTPLKIESDAQRPIVEKSAIKTPDHLKQGESKSPNVKNLPYQQREPVKQDDFTLLQKRVNQRNQRNKSVEESINQALNLYGQCGSFHPAKMLEVLTAWHNSFIKILPEKESWYGLGTVLLQCIERTSSTSFNSEHDRLRFLAAPVAKAIVNAYDNTLPDDAVLCVARLLQKYLAVASYNHPGRAEFASVALNKILPRLCSSKKSSDWMIAQEMLEKIDAVNHQQITLLLTLASNFIDQKMPEPALKILQAQKNNYATKQYRQQATVHRIACAQLLQEKGSCDQAIEALKEVITASIDQVGDVAKVGSLCIRSFCTHHQYLQAAQVFRDLSVIRSHADVQAELKKELPAIINSLLGIGAHEALSLSLTLITVFNLHTSDYWDRWWTATAKSSDTDLINRGWESFHNVELAEHENWDDCLTKVFEIMTTSKRAKKLFAHQDSILNLFVKIQKDDVYTSCLVGALKVGLIHANTLPINKRQPLFAFLVNLYAQKAHSRIGKEEIERQIILALLNLSPKEMPMEAVALAVVCIENFSNPDFKSEDESIQRLLDPIFDRALLIGEISDEFLGAMHNSNLSPEYIAAKARAFSKNESLALKGMYLLSMVLKNSKGPISATTHTLTLSILEDLAKSEKTVLLEQSVMCLCTAFANPDNDRTQWIPTAETLLNHLLVDVELRGSLDANVFQTLGKVIQQLSKHLNLSDLNLIAEISDCLIHLVQNDPHRQATPENAFKPFFQSLGWPALNKVDHSPLLNATVMQQCLAFTEKIVEQLSRQHLLIDELWTDMLYRCLMTLPHESHLTHSQLILQALYIMVIRNSKLTGELRNVKLLDKWGSQMPACVVTTLKTAHQIIPGALHDSLNILNPPVAIDLLIALCGTLYKQDKSYLLLDGVYKILRVLPTVAATDQTYCLRRLLILTVEVGLPTASGSILNDISITISNNLFENAAILLSSTPDDPDLFNAASDILFSLSYNLITLRPHPAALGPIKKSWNRLLDQLIMSSAKVCHHRSTLIPLVDIVCSLKDAGLGDHQAKDLVEKLQTSIRSSAHPLAKVARLAVFQEAHNFNWSSNLDEHLVCASETWETSERELMALPIENSVDALRTATKFVQASLYTAFDTLQCRVKNFKPETITAWFEKWCSKTGEILTSYQQTSDLDGPKDLLKFMRSIQLALTNFIDTLSPAEIRPDCAELWLTELNKKQSHPQDHSLKAEILRASHFAWKQIMIVRWGTKKNNQRKL